VSERAASGTGVRARVESFLVEEVWAVDLVGLGWLRRQAYRAARIAYLTARGFRDHRASTRASGLTYVTVLSIVPLLAMGFSVAKGFRAYDRLRADVVEPFLDRTFGAGSPDGTGSELRSAIDQVFGFVERTDFGSLGAIGLLVLVWTVIKLLSAVEHTLNDIWGVKRARTLARKFADYLSLVIVVPLLLVAATTVTTAIQSDHLPAHLGEAWAKLLAFVTTTAGFTMVYLLVPNTRVRLASAALGGLFAGVLWQVAQVAHVSFQIGVARYNAIYSTFAALPVFLVWLFVSWSILLLGAELASAHAQEPAFRRSFQALRLGPLARRVAALRVCVAAVRAFQAGGAPPEAASLAQQIQLPEALVREVAADLDRGGVLRTVEAEGEGLALVPARPVDQLRLTDILDAVEGTPARLEELAGASVEASALVELRAALQASAANLDLATLAARDQTQGA
jgi:membrane protein